MTSTIDKIVMFDPKDSDEPFPKADIRSKETLEYVSWTSGYFCLIMTAEVWDSSLLCMGGIHMECARQGCDKDAIAGSNYCKEHFELDKANVDNEENGEGGGEGGEGGE